MVERGRKIGDVRKAAGTGGIASAGRQREQDSERPWRGVARGPATTLRAAREKNYWTSPPARPPLLVGQEQGEPTGRGASSGQI